MNMVAGYRHTASFGKRQEFGAIAELLRRGYDVYLTLVDDQGIDCVVRQGPERYFDIQIKARSKDCNPKNAGHFPQLDVPTPRKNYVFIFYSEHINTYWVIPSTVLVSDGFSNRIKSGNSEGKFRVMLTNYSESKSATSARPKYTEWIDAFERVFGPPVGKALGYQAESAI